MANNPTYEELLQKNRALEKEVILLKKTEHALKESERKYRGLFEHMNSGVAVYEAAGNGTDFLFLDFNRAAQKIDKVNRKDIIGKFVTEVFPGVKEFGIFEAFQRVWRTGTAEHFPIKSYRDGRISGWRDNFIYKLNSGEIVAIYEDVSERKQAEETSIKSEALLNEVGDIAKIGGWEMDLITRKAKWTKGTYDIVEIDPDDPAPGPDEHLSYYLPDYRPLVEESMKNLIEQDLPLDFEARLKTAKGNIKWCRALGRTTRENGKCIRIYGTFQDISKQKQTEQELKQHREHLEELVEERTSTLAAANTELKDFAYIVSHDLKAPLRAVSQLSYWISEDHGDKLGDEGKKQISLLINRVKRMDGLINGILQYSRIGRTREKKEKVNLHALVLEVIDAISPPEEIDISIENRLPTIVCDRTQMEQLFQNLLSNAVKFMDGPDGTIRLRCDDRETRWQFSVRDNGPGIDPKYHNRIFKIFQTLSSRDERESTGIGLTLVKKIVELYGGRVWVESKTGEGSTFFFTILKG